MSLYIEKTIVDFADAADAPLALNPRIVRAGSGRAYSYLGPGQTGTCLMDAVSTGGAYSAFTLTLEPGAGVPLHVHTNEDEVFYVIEGKFEIRKGNEIYTLEAGMSVFGPRNVPHAFFNVGGTAGRIFVVATPGGFENFFAAIEAGEAVYGDLSTLEAQMAFGKLMAEWGIQPVFEALEPMRMGYPPAMTASGLGDHRGRLLVGAEESNGALMFADVEVDPQGGPPPHVHHREDEGFYILSGRLELMVGDLVTEIGPGDFAFGPRHIPHCWRNVGETPLYLLAIVTPGANFQAFALEMEQFIKDAGMGLTEVTDPAYLQQMGMMFHKYGLEPAQFAQIK